jgi:hypothetical protein
LISVKTTFAGFFFPLKSGLKRFEFFTASFSLRRQMMFAIIRSLSMVLLVVLVLLATAGESAAQFPQGKTSNDRRVSQLSKELSRYQTKHGEKTGRASDIVYDPSQYKHVKWTKPEKAKVINYYSTPSGNLIDPSGRKFNPITDNWHMGHKRGYEQWRLAEAASRARISPPLLQNWQRENMLNIIRPELASTNLSHRYEMPRSATGVLSRTTTRVVASIPAAARATTPVTRVAGTLLQRSAPKVGGVVLIVGGVFDVGYGAYVIHDTERRYSLGELDSDIRTGKLIIGGSRIVVGAAAIAAGVLIIVPEPVYTKAAAAGIIVGVIVAVVVIEVVDYALERIQAKRTAERLRLAQEIDETERYHIVFDELRKMI